MYQYAGVSCDNVVDIGLDNGRRPTSILPSSLFARLPVRHWRDTGLRSSGFVSKSLLIQGIGLWRRRTPKLWDLPGFFELLLAGNGPDGAVDLSITCCCPGLDPDTGAGADVAFEDGVAAAVLEDAVLKQTGDAAPPCPSSSSAERACASKESNQTKIQLN